MISIQSLSSRGCSAALAGLVVAAAAAASWSCGGSRQSQQEEASAPVSAGGAGGQAAPAAAEPAASSTVNASGAAASERAAATLYFADGSGQLRPEKRVISEEGTAARRARLVVEALLEGPRGRLTPVLPSGSALRAFYLGEDGTAYVDLDAAFARGVSRGSEDALLAVWSLTDTLAVNFPEVRRVKILVEGEEVKDLGGHLDLSRPLVPDVGLVER